MDERLTRAGMAVVWLVCAGAACAQAQALSDPMRPPGPGGAAQADAAGATPGATTAPARLQSVLLSKSRKLAVIDGQTVFLGGDLGDAKLVRISETEVTLKRGEEFETLRMHEGVSKKMIARKPPRAPAGARATSDRDRSAP